MIDVYELIAVFCGEHNFVDRINNRPNGVQFLDVLIWCFPFFQFFFDFLNGLFTGPAQIGFGQKQLTATSWVLFSGDMDQAADVTISDINGTDRVHWQNQNGNFLTYNFADVNMDGDVTGIDKILWSNNNGYANRVPK